MKSRFDIKFWAIKFKKHFELNRIGGELLDRLIYENKQAAEEFIRDNYNRKFYREDFIDMFCDKYDKDKINDLLQQLEYEPLTEQEIKDYEIKENELEMEV